MKKTTKEAEGCNKKPVTEEDGKLIKESEAESEDEDEDEMEKEAESEAEDEEEEETEEERKKRKKSRMKGELGGENPKEQADAANQSGATLSPNAGVPSTQNVFVPQSQVSTGRVSGTGSFAGGQSPSEVTYTGKALASKSPLFVELSKQIDGIKENFDKKMEATAKSINDRIENLNKAVAQVEKFYASPMYKAVSENVGPEVTLKKGITQQIKDGEVRYR